MSNGNCRQKDPETNKYFTLTSHLRERYVERFRNRKKYQHLEFCKTEGCTICHELQQEVRTEVRDNLRDLNQELIKRLGKAKENRAYVNNTQFMDGMYNRYGYDSRFSFLVDEEILFVVLERGGQKIVPTCFYTATSIVGKIESRPKYRKRA